MTYARDDLRPVHGIAAGTLLGSALWLLLIWALTGCSPSVRDYTPTEMWIMCAPGPELERAAIGQKGEPL